MKTANLLKLSLGVLVAAAFLTFPNTSEAKRNRKPDSATHMKSHAKKKLASAHHKNKSKHKSAHKLR